MGTYSKQEQEPAGNEITELAPNVLRMQLPISMPGLGHVNCYALLDERGVAIVDTGVPGPQTWKALTQRLSQAGIKVTDIHTVLITHSHPDHFGTAGKVAEESGAEIVTHSAFRSWWHPHSHTDAADDVVIHDVDPADLPEPRTGPIGPRGGYGAPTPWGGKSFRPPMKRRMAIRMMGGMMRSRMSKGYMPPVPSNKLKNGDVIKLAGREWFAIHTPGHTLDHLCLHDPEAGLLISGDHVLPTITPHISGMNTGRDPLALFFSSLDRVGALDDVRLVLPAHGHPFADLKGRTEDIKEHHRERLVRLQKAAVDTGPTTVEEFSHHLFRPERWGSMAESETYAHLEHLRLLGQAERHEENGVMIYDLAAPGSSA